MTKLHLTAAAATTLAITLSPAAPADEPADLSRYFGFDEKRIIVVDSGFGPAVTADFNGNGRPDLAVVNNRKSRIEIHYLREKPLDEGELARRSRINDLPASPWYERKDVSVSHRVQALRAYDVDGDGRMDLVYAGSNPSEIVILRQAENGQFETLSRRRVQGLSARQRGLEIADVVGDDVPELIALVDDRIKIFPLSRTGSLGEPLRIGSGANLAGFFVEDFNGNGLSDVLAVAPDDSAPLRVWLQRQDPRSPHKSGMLASELRFEMPPLREAQTIRFPDRDAASIGVVERASRRMVFFDLVTQPVEAEPGADREVQVEVWAFPDGGNPERSAVVVDLDGDGLPDILATDQRSNTLTLFRQSRHIGPGPAESFSTFKRPRQIAVGTWDDPDRPAIFVLSEEERAVGVSAYDERARRLAFPTPISIATPGHSPVAIGVTELDGRGHLAVVVRDRRNHALELHAPDSDPRVIQLEGVNRPPQSMLSADADQDGLQDLLLFLPNEPMVMVRTERNDDGDLDFEVLTDRDMPQYGLVQTAGPHNTALLDVDGNGHAELLIADDNFVRACRYDPEAGWRVVEQITLTETGTDFVGLTTLDLRGETVIVAADRGNERLVIIGPRDHDAAEGWAVRKRIRVKGFALGKIRGGQFAGDGQPSILCFGDEAFALVRFAGERAELDSFAAYRSDSEDRSEHTMAVGDLNNDGFVDIAVLESGEQMCQILTFSASRNIHHATEFEVFQSRLFTRGQARQQEPRSALVADLTGNGRDDLLLVVHDRIIIYPQATEPGTDDAATAQR